VIELKGREFDPWKGESQVCGQSIIKESKTNRSKSSMYSRRKVLDKLELVALLYDFRDVID